MRKPARLELGDRLVDRLQQRGAALLDRDGVLFEVDRLGGDCEFLTNEQANMLCFLGGFILRHRLICVK